MANILPAFIVIAIILVVVFAELIKKLDGKNRLKGYRVWIPAALSGGAAWLLRLGDFFDKPQQVWFWWAAIFAFSVFAYEAVLRKITAALGDKKEAVF